MSTERAVDGRGRVVPFSGARMGRVLTYEQVADVLQVSECTVRRLVDTGQLMRITIASRVRITEAELARFIESRTAEAAAEFGRSGR